MSVLDQFKLDGKVAVVTGASRGLGQAMAIGLAEAGADVISVSRSGEANNTKAAVEAIGRQFSHIQMDFAKASASDLQNLVRKIISDHDQIDILVNNSGAIRRSPAVSFSEGAWDSVIQVNMKAGFFLSQAVAHHMHMQGGGKIIFTSSILGDEGGLLVASYTASKHGINGIVKALSNEWSGYNIQVNAIAPGYFETDMTEPLQKDRDRNEALMSRIPTGRFGKPEELKGLVVYLASEASSYVSGSVFPIDGGWLAR
ncbi:MAG: SDR family NAD(P)-dependent oxidoreductase [Chloroflexota bacterium]